jgi:hypothetical protein
MEAKYLKTGGRSHEEETEVVIITTAARIG